MLIILPSKETLGVFVEDFLPLEMCSVVLGCTMFSSNIRCSICFACICSICMLCLFGQVFFCSFFLFCFVGGWKDFSSLIVLIKFNAMHYLASD